MPESLRLDPEALLAAAAAIEGEAARLVAIHSGCDEAVRSAMPGWIGRSRRALDDLAVQWTSDTAALTARLYDLASGLRISAESFAAMDRSHARSLSD